METFRTAKLTNPLTQLLKYMKEHICDVCDKSRANNKVICDSEKCSIARLLAYNIDSKYFPSRGCDNCWGDLGTGCSDTCRQEHRESLRFGQDLWVLVHYLSNHPRSDELYKTAIDAAQNKANPTPKETT